MRTGKDFEVDFKNSFEKYNHISIDRFHDGVGGYAIKNVSDFVAYRMPHEYYFELKSYQGSKIYFDAISDYQIKGLNEKIKVNGVLAGVIFNFREFDKSYFISIITINTMISLGLKGISIEEAEDFGVLMPVAKKRIKTFDYDIETFMNGLEEKYFKTN